MIATIYGLVDPRDGALRYVGKTVRPLAVRLRQAITEARRLNRNRKHRWLNKLAAEGVKPEIFVIEETTNWIEDEPFWIAYFRMIGANLVNTAFGGEGASGPKSEEHKAKLAEALRGRKPPNFGKKASAETRKRIGDVQRGKPKGPPSESHRAALSRANLGKTKGKPWSAVRKAAFTSEDRTWTPERREKRAKTMAARKAAGIKRKDAGRPRSEEQKESFNAALAERRAAGWHPRWNPTGGVA